MFSLIMHIINIYVYVIAGYGTTHRYGSSGGSNVGSGRGAVHVLRMEVGPRGFGFHPVNSLVHVLHVEVDDWGK